MNTLTKNEIITLKYLADGKDHKEAPNGLTNAQFYTALKSLQSKKMVRAAFLEGEEVYSSHILNPGLAALDDLFAKEDSKQDDSLEENWNNELAVIEFLSDGKEHFDEPDIEDYDEICDYLSGLGLVTLPETKDDGIKLSYKGKQYWKQYQKQEEETNILQLGNKESLSESIHEIKDSGFRIKEDRITDVIKTIWSMHRTGMFVDIHGNRPTIKSVMDAFAIFLQSKQLKQYSVYMNKALKMTKNTYLEVFYKMEKSAEKHYDSQMNRKIDK